VHTLARWHAGATRTPFAGLVGLIPPAACRVVLATGYVVAFLELEKCLLDDDYFRVLTIISITLQLGKDLLRTILLEKF